jgi:hypothetical protein
VLIDAACDGEREVSLKAASDSSSCDSSSVEGTSDDTLLS